MNDFSIAILGASGFGKFHAREFAKAGCNVKAILGSSKNSSEKTVRELYGSLGIKARPYHELENLLEQENLTAVSICTPPNMHYQQTKKCLEANLHVLCEKPFVLEPSNENYPFAKNLFELAKIKNKTLTVNTPWPSVCGYLDENEKRDMTSFSMQMEPGQKGKNMIIDALPHMNSMLTNLIPNGFAKNIRFLVKEDEKTSVEFDYISDSKICKVNYNFNFKTERPRNVSFSINGRYFSRKVEEGYKQKIVTDGREFYIDDPLKVCIRKFVGSISGKDSLLIGEQEILENIKLQDDILENY